MLKHGFSKFLEANNTKLHFAAHSHHFWPDVTLDAQQEAWEIAAKYVDEKWGKDVFSRVMPEVKSQIAEQLQLPQADSIAFAPNTHEFVLRLLSCFKTPIRILTTDSEFHSFSRQMKRMEEDDLVVVTRVETEPFDSFTDRFTKIANLGKYDLAFCSHVFFNSGFAVPDLTSLVNNIEDKDCFVVIDGYHGFMALPTDLSEIADRAFYMAGGYKYAMSGEGCCFMHCPPEYGLRPVNTGWWAAFSGLEGAQEGVPYDAGGGRFMGATFDPMGLYRFHAVQNWLEAENITVENIHNHVHKLQELFVSKLNDLQIDSDILAVPIENEDRGHFLTFKSENAGELHDELLSLGVMTDYRGDRLRFGFAVYHDENDVEELVARISELL